MSADPEILVRRGVEPALVATIIVSALVHAGAVGLLFALPDTFLRSPPRLESYTVDLVAADTIGGTNLVVGGRPQAKPAPVAPKIVEPAPAPEPAKVFPPPVAEAPQPPAQPPPKVEAAEPPKSVEPPAPPVPEPVPPKPAEPAPPKPVEAVPPKPVEPVPPKPAEAVPPKPAEPVPPKPVEPVKPEPQPASAPAKPIVADQPKPPPPKPAAEAKPVDPQPKPPQPAAKPESPKSAAEVAKPVPEKPAAAKPQPAAAARPESQQRDQQIAAAVQRRATEQAQDDKRDRAIAAAVQRRAAQAGSGAVAGSDADGGPASVGPGQGSGGTPMDIEFILYQGKMEERIKAAWAWAGAKKQLQAVIQFNVAPDGVISNVRTSQSSGDAQYDASCERAVRSVSPLDPVPEKYRSVFSKVEMTFKPEDLES